MWQKSHLPWLRKCYQLSCLQFEEKSLLLDLIRVPPDTVMHLVHWKRAAFPKTRFLLPLLTANQEGQNCTQTRILENPHSLLMRSASIHWCPWGTRGVSKSQVNGGHCTVKALVLFCMHYRCSAMKRRGQRSDHAATILIFMIHRHPYIPAWLFPLIKTNTEDKSLVLYLNQDSGLNKPKLETNYWSDFRFWLFRERKIKSPDSDNIMNSLLSGQL